jgi:phosphoglycolate phosphatase
MTAPRAVAEAVEYVIWDWNGTLLDDHEHCAAVVNVLLREAGLPETNAEGYRRHFRFPAKSYYEHLGLSTQGESWEKLARRFIDVYDAGVEQCSLHAGAREALAALQARGCKHSILSAARTVSLEPLLQQHGIRGFFTDVIGLDNHYAHGKVELGTRWLREKGIPPTRALLVGDTLHDLEVATAMGVRCVLVAAGHQARDRLEASGCPVISDLSELV